MKQTKEHVFTLFTPDQAAFECPLVVDSPHSGTFYPKDFHYSCSHDLLKQGEDLFVDQLFRAAPKVGGYLLRAEFSRSYIDLNRSLTCMDLDLCAEHWPEETEKSERVKYGMGVIRRLAKPGVPVYSRKLTNAEIYHRMDDYYRPYHSILQQTLSKVHEKFGMVVHINAHSMPSRNLEGGRHPDFVIGDRKGRTSSPEIRNRIANFLRDQGFNVTINTPYQGVELISKYSDPANNRHSVQIEINKDLYMNEIKYEKNKNYDVVKAVLSDMLSDISSHTRAFVNAAVAGE